MNKWKTISLALKERLYILFHKDPMKVRIERYRCKGMIIGDKCRIFTSINSPEPYLIEIGDNVTIASRVHLITHDNSAIKLYDGATDFVGKITIGDDCFIGADSILLPGIRLAENTIVGAGAVVTKSFDEPGMVIAGNPAKIIATVQEMKEKNKDKTFDFRGMSMEQRKECIYQNPERWLSR